jgi:chromate reductase, NAD(P)H dehydrogenase (quinone)
MTPQKRVAVLVGSLRKGSFTRMAVNSLIEVAPAELKLEIKQIGNLPLYNQDSDEGNPPAAWASFRQEIKTADAVLFATPEYNRSVPGVLKNAIDVASRPYGNSAWNGKPGAVISVSPGQYGGFGANHHLRQSLVFLNVPVLRQPEAYIAKAAELFRDGKLIDDKMPTFFESYMQAFAAWINLFQPAKLQSKP